MRYRRISVSYAFMVRPGPEPLGAGFPPQRVRLAQPWWRPSADIAETDAALVVMAELAGVSIDDIDLLFYEDAVVIEGRRHLPPPPPDARYHAAEIRQGPFRLEVPLPCRVDHEATRARYENGLLVLEFPKQQRGGKP